MIETERDIVTSLLSTLPSVNLNKLRKRVNQLGPDSEISTILFGEVPVWAKTEYGYTEFAVTNRSDLVDSETAVEGYTVNLGTSNMLKRGWCPDWLAPSSIKVPPVKIHEGARAEFSTNHPYSFCIIEGGVCYQPFSPKSTSMGMAAAVSRKNESQPHHLHGHTLVCSVPGSNIFVHWILDVLPILLLLDEKEGGLGRFDHIVINSARSRFHQSTLADLGIGSDKIIERNFDNRGKHFTTDQFTFVSPVRFRTATHKSNIQRVVEFFRTGANKQGLTDLYKKPRRIYLARGSYGKRCVVHEEQFFPLLRKYGFSIIHAEQYGPYALSSLMDECEILIGAHGAALANMIFCPLDTLVMELYGPHLSPDYWTLAGILQQKHALTQGTLLDGNAIPKSILNSTTREFRNPYPIVMSPQVLEDTLRLVDEKINNQ